jgi:hypothetical protein
MDTMNSRQRTPKTTPTKQRGSMRRQSRRLVEDPVTSVGALLICAALVFLGLLASMLLLALGF